MECMGQLELFLHDDRAGMPALIKAGPAPVQFETIHPFLDGNRRLGRLLITFLLCSGGVMRAPILYLSLYFKRNRAAYYELPDRVRARGDWEAWLDFFLRGVKETPDEAAEAARRIVALFDEHRRRIESLGRPPTSALRVLEMLQRNPTLSIPVLAWQSGLSGPTVAKSLEHLDRIGIVKEITGRERNRLFVYDRYPEILNEGMASSS
jgi:Fic family protein